MSRDRIAVVVAADRGFAKQLAATVAGLSAHAARAHDVYVLHDGFDDDLIGRVATAGGDAVTLHWRRVRDEDLVGARLPHYIQSTATLFRLQLADLVPAEVERLVYLDLDLLVRRPLDELWDADLDGCVLAAVRDPVLAWAGAPNGLRWREMGVPPDAPYFNAGVLVVDVGAWRAQGIGTSAREALAGHDLRHSDQCALNAVLAGRWAPLHPRWNLQAGHLAEDGSLAWITEGADRLDAAIADPAIVHFNTSSLGRPWVRGCVHPWRDGWFEQLDRTPWAGWRPPSPIVSGPLRRVARRVRRATRELLHG